MGAVTKTFKSGNSVAVRLPKEIGLQADVELLVERTGDLVVMRPKPKMTPADLIAKLREIGPPATPTKRQKILFPKRRGL